MTFYSTSSSRSSSTSTSSHSSRVTPASDVSPEKTFTIPIKTALTLPPFSPSSSAQVSSTAVVAAAVSNGYVLFNSSESLTSRRKQVLGQQVGWFVNLQLNLFNMVTDLTAVAGTFSVVALIIVGISAAAAVILIRQRRSRRVNLEDDISYTNRYPEPDLDGPSSPGPSMTELATHTPMDPYQGNDMVYSSPAHHDRYPTEDLFAQQDYSRHPTSGTVYPIASNQGEQYNDYVPHHDSAPDHFFTPQISSSPVSHPYTHPTVSANLAPPTSYREKFGRDSGYQQSIDSFYGGATPGHAV